MTRLVSRHDIKRLKTPCYASRLIQLLVFRCTMYLLELLLWILDTFILCLLCRQQLDQYHKQLCIRLAILEHVSERMGPVLAQNVANDPWLADVDAYIGMIKQRRR